MIFAVVIIGTFFVLSGLGPRSAGSTNEGGISDVTALALLERSREMEDQFDERILQGLVDDQDLEVLQRAVDLQEEFIAALPARDYSAEGRLERLERKFEEYMGEILAREAERLEAEASGIESFDSGRAAVLYGEALLIREQIREKYGSSSYSDLAELSRLQRRVQQMDIQPLYEKSVALELEGEELEKKGDLSRAVERFSEAADIQEQINRAYSGSALSKPLRANRLREKEAQVLSGRLKLEIDGLLTEANDFVYEEKYDEAAVVFSRAREIQRNLTLEYPRSPFASRAREELLRVRKQNASAFPEYERLRGMESQLNQALFDRNIDQAELMIGQISDRLDQFNLRYSLSTLPIEKLAERVAFLQRKKRSLRQISSSITADLLPVPGRSNLEMYSTEVPQYLYELIVDSNPSRNAGPNLPVETVSLQEIELFLERGEWVLARVMRLPTLAEFQELAQKALDEEGLEILSSEAGKSGTQPINSLAPDSQGFYHLLGNISEVVRISDDSAEVSRVGGSVRMIATQIAELDPSPMNAGERNRTVGFRFVVENKEMPLSLPEKPTI